MTRSLIALALLCSLVTGGDRVPFRVTCRPVFVPNACLPVESKPVCVKIDGIDYDLDVLLSEYNKAWTWPDNTEAGLRQHLKATHRIEGIDDLSFDQVRKIHSVIHERELRKTRSVAPPVAIAPSPRGGCPGGVCPQSNGTRSMRGRGFLFWR